MQEKSGKLEETAALLGLKINSSKNKVLRINSKNSTPITMDQNALEDVNSFTYLGSIINIQHAKQYLEGKKPVTQDQTANLQLKRKNHSTLWL